MSLFWLTSTASFPRTDVPDQLALLKGKFFASYSQSISRLESETNDVISRARSNALAKNGIHESVLLQMGESPLAPTPKQPQQQQTPSKLTPATVIPAGPADARAYYARDSLAQFVPHARPALASRTIAESLSHPAASHPRSRPMAVAADLSAPSPMMVRHAALHSPSPVVLKPVAVRTPFGTAVGTAAVPVPGMRPFPTAAVDATGVAVARSMHRTAPSSSASTHEPVQHHPVVLPFAGARGGARGAAVALPPGTGLAGALVSPRHALGLAATRAAQDPFAEPVSVQARVGAATRGLRRTLRHVVPVAMPVVTSAAAAVAAAGPGTVAVSSVTGEQSALDRQISAILNE